MIPHTIYIIYFHPTDETTLNLRKKRTFNIPHIHTGTVKSAVFSPYATP
jgi:hypothetical protein